MKRYFVASVFAVGIAASVALSRPMPRGFTPPAKPPNTVVEPDSPLNRELVAAEKKADVISVSRLLDEGASADVMVGWDNSPDRTPLAVVASYDWQFPNKNGIFPATQPPSSRKIFDLIIDHVQKPNAASTWSKETPLMAAAELEDVPAAKHLIDIGAQIDARNIVRAFGSQTTAKGVRTMQGGGETALQWALDTAGNQLRAAVVPPVVAYLIGRGADVNAADVNGHTPLMAAAQFGGVTLVRALLAKGADPAKRDLDGRDALAWASMRGKSDVIALLTPLSTLHMSLFEAATFGKVDQVNRCLASGADPNALDWRGWTPLMCAVTSNSPAVVEVLIGRGAKVNGVGRAGSTALDTAASWGYVGIAKILIAHGADVNASYSPPRSTIFRTPLSTAIASSHADVVQLLLSHHIDLASHDAGANALEAAVRQCGFVTNNLHRMAPSPPKRTDDQVLDDQWRIVNLLLTHGVSAAVNHSQALHLAASNGQAGVVALLLRHGADINARSTSRDGIERGATPLRAAIDGFAIDDARQQQSMETIHLLLSRHAAVNIADGGGVTPLEYAVEIRRRDLVMLLLAHGAKVDTVDSDGFTPLMTTACFCDVATAQLLIAHGAAGDVNARNKQGYTSLMLAAYIATPQEQMADNGDEINIQDRLTREDAWQNSFDGILSSHYREAEPSTPARVAFVKFLLAHHADASTKGPGGVTALGFARKNGLAPLIPLFSPGQSTDRRAG